MSQEIAKYAMGPLGIPVDLLMPSAMLPTVVLYGPPGGGKTFEMAHAFPNNFYVQSQGDVLRYAEQYSIHNPKRMPYIPKHRVTLDEQTVARFYGGSFLTALNTIVGMFVQAAQQGKNPYEGITFDEWNTHCKRVFEEMTRMEQAAAAQQNRKFNVFNTFTMFRTWHGQMLSIGRATGLSVCFVSHAQYPKYFDEPGDPRVGQVKVPGGPRFPQGVASELAELCQEASAVIEMTVKSKPKPALLIPLPPLPPPSGGVTPLPPLAIPGMQVAPSAPPPIPPPVPAGVDPILAKNAAAEAEQDRLEKENRILDGSPRILRTGLTPEWFRKLRGLGFAVEEPVIEGEFGLRELLQKAGYKVGQFYNS